MTDIIFLALAIETETGRSGPEARSSLRQPGGGEAIARDLAGVAWDRAAGAEWRLHGRADPSHTARVRARLCPDRPIHARRQSSPPDSSSASSLFVMLGR